MNVIEIDKKLMRGKQPKVIMCNDVWVAGGSIRSWFNGWEKISDIDIFAKSEQALENFRKGMKLEKPVFSTPITDTYNDNNQKIQLIKLYRNTIEDLFDCFDFTICQFAWDGNDIFSTIEGVITTERKHLSVHKVQKGFEVDSLRRAFKYFEKGYKPCLGTIGELGKSLAGTELKEIEHQIQISPGGNKRIVRWD